MDRNCSWKRTEEVEIDLLDLFRRLCVQWKRIAVCALVCAVLAGTGSFLHSRNSTGEAPDTAVEGNVSQSAAEIKDPLTKEEREQSEAQVKRLKEEIDGLEEYLDHSILMQMDPYHKHSVSLLFSVEGTQGWAAQKVAESYLNFLNFGAADAVREAERDLESVDSSYLAELITAAQKAGSTYQADGTQEELSGVLLQVGVAGIDAAMAKRLAADVVDVLKGYSPAVEKACGRHTLRLVNRTAGEKVDSALLAHQREKKAVLTANRTSLKALADGLSSGQSQASAAVSVSELPQAGQQEGSFSVAAVLFGFLGGIFLYCAAYACWYMLRDTIRSEGEFKSHYAIPFYGSVCKEGKSASVSAQQQDGGRKGQAQMLSRIRLSCQKQGITKLCLATDLSLGGQEKAFWETALSQLQEWGIHAKLVESIGESAALWDSKLLGETEAVVLVCGMGSTPYRMVDETVEFCLDNEVVVLGAAALDRWK